MSSMWKVLLDKQLLQQIICKEKQNRETIHLKIYINQMPGFIWIHIQIKQQLKNFVRQSEKLNTEHVKELSNFQCGNDIIMLYL